MKESKRLTDRDWRKKYDRGDLRMSHTLISPRELAMYKKLAEYEDALDERRVIISPCPIGIRVYLVGKDMQIHERFCDIMFLGVLWDEYKISWFLTEKEAKDKLKEEIAECIDKGGNDD